MSPLLSAAAGRLPEAVTVTGWTASATMGAITNVILAIVGGGGLKILASYLLDMKKIAQSRASQVDARSDQQNEALTKRVTELETALSLERRECDKQLAEMRGELREMQTKVDGFVRQLIAFQTSEARALPLSPVMARAMDSLDKVRSTDATE